MIGMTCSRQQHPSTPPSAKRCPPLTGILSQNLARRLLGKKKNLVPAKRKRSKLSYLNGRRVGLDDSGRRVSRSSTTFRQVGGDRSARASHLRRQPIQLLTRKARRDLVDRQGHLMRLLPDLEFAKIFHLTSCTGQRSPGRISGFPPALYPMILLSRQITPERRTDGNLPQAVCQPAHFCIPLF